jgi:hypothetical protein
MKHQRVREGAVGEEVMDRPSNASVYSICHAHTLYRCENNLQALDLECWGINPS